MNNSKQSTEERPDYDELAYRLAPRLTFDNGTMHTLGDVAAHVVAELWTREPWDQVTRVTEEIQALCDRFGKRTGATGVVCLSRAQADVLDDISSGFNVLASVAATWGARWGYALAQTAEDHRHGRAAWLGAAAAIAGREGCTLEEHDWWLDWWTRDQANHLRALRLGQRYLPIPHPATRAEEGGAPR